MKKLIGFDNKQKIKVYIIYFESFKKKYSLNFRTLEISGKSESLPLTEVQDIGNNAKFHTIHYPVCSRQRPIL